MNQTLDPSSQIKKIRLKIDQWKSLREERSTEMIRVAARLMLPGIFMIWFIYLSISSPVFLSWLNLFNVSRQVAVMGIVTLGQLLCLITGNIDLSVGAFLGLIGAVLAGESIKYGVVPALGLSALLVLVWGSFNGFLVSRGRGISVIVTLSTLYIARGITLIYTEGRPVVGFPMPYAFLGQDNLGPVPWSLILFSLVALIIHYILKYTALGRHLYATGGNRQAAEICGINLTKITFFVFISSALLSTIGAIVLLGRVASAQANAGYGMELDTIAAVLIGGASVSGGYGAVFPTLLGIFMLGFINNGLNLLGVSSYYQYVLKGIIILIAVVVDQIAGKGKV